MDRAEVAKKQRLEHELQAHGLPASAFLTPSYRQLLSERLDNLKSDQVDDPLVVTAVTAAVQECVAKKNAAMEQYTAWLSSAGAAELEDERAAIALPQILSRVRMQIDRINWFNEEVVKKQTPVDGEGVTVQPPVLWFPKTLQSWERAELHWHAQDLGLETQSEGLGTDRRLTVFKRP